MVTVLSIIAFGLMCDIVLNSGVGIATVIGTKKEDSANEYNNPDVTFARELVDEIDSLIDDLTYDNSPEEIDCIKAKIQLREKILDRLTT